MPEQRIYKHNIGLIITFLIGGGLMVFFVYQLWYTLDPASIEYILTALVVAALGAATIFTILTYASNRVVLSTSGILFDRHLTPWDDHRIELDWNAVQSVSVKQDLLGRVFNYGTLTVKTAEGSPHTTMTMLTRAPYWKRFIDDHATLGGPADA